MAMGFHKAGNKQAETVKVITVIFRSHTAVPVPWDTGDHLVFESFT